MDFVIENNTLKKYEGNEAYVIVPETVEYISDYAFSHAKSMKRICLPERLKEIEDGAFYDCENLEEIEIPDSVYYIGTGVFSRCLGLKKVKLSSRMMHLPKITFYQCESLVEVIFPKNIRKLCRACFQQCKGLESISLPDTIVEIEENAFDDCVRLKHVKLSAFLEVLGDNVFFHCESLKTLIFPASLQKIGTGALETHGKISVIANNSLLMRSFMFDHNWNMNWNFGANGRYNGKNEENYQLVQSYLPHVSLKEWKLEARVILCVNYLEMYKEDIDYYNEWIQSNIDLCLEKMVSEKRFVALNQGLDIGVIQIEALEPYLNRIYDWEEKAKLLEMSQSKKSKIDDLWDLL
ncbi:MAG: leucine-rich repeat domain-containing protein [Firmicutes bacterium]|nr:leucine-rich repeat domain-containing protein [Bacillota bacterium]